MQFKRTLLLLFILLLILLPGACQFIEREPVEIPDKPQIQSEEQPEEPDKVKGELKSEESAPGPVKEVVSPEIGDGPEQEHRELSMENIVKIFGTTVFRQGSKEGKTIALTFDDGPDNKYTPLILDILKEYGVKATFFITGVLAKDNLTVLRRIDAEGHEIAHHGYHHYKMSNLTPEKITEELELFNRLSEAAIDKTSRVFRPPYGAIDVEMVETIRDAGYYIVLWDIDSLDWRSLPKEQVLENVLPELHPGAIILQHSAGGSSQNLMGTVEALPVIISTLIHQGYQFVTISEMFANRMVSTRLNQ